ncbi:Bifunctional purine biosynthetic protein ADE5,7 [Friedmanniomyces endolithicus]|uniref:phosphoribosylglycinamide formyltransferase 1 n=1 Tax=Friedmanniomyces endolithicus TaxID=329885 RepID=A0AAN6FL55_9PEZI|nr:Bifunctional purine biosynthetic protein ADE5,7 [Friedmanniomyces endolithicus]KAK0294542.1 Bifunctional purine biosynthetic protein ADE5,7 [Friedmanniomyces endolithicus]KAK0318142.1 Bifunctional purine biosynthetic protein ADE5,7 [Friedmanniomyces endolithicus]KAK1009853.1 Bifunctional purine biosynthetic protein ADE5,7 [Friedmanniomyces endolithicus]
MNVSLPPPARITVLISGKGTNLQALVDACNTDHLPNSNIVRVVSDRKNAYGLQRAQAVSIPTTYHGILSYKQKYPDSDPEPKFDAARKAYDADLASILFKDQPDLVVCAGFMRILTTAFLNPVKEKKIPIINLHPSKPGDLLGADCINRAWDEFEAGTRTETGIMIHYVIEEVDMGEPIVSETINITGCQSLEDLEAKIHDREHGLIVKGAKTALAQLQTHGKLRTPRRFAYLQPMCIFIERVTSETMAIMQDAALNGDTPTTSRADYATAIARSQPAWDKMTAHANSGSPYPTSEKELIILQDPSFSRESPGWRPLPTRCSLLQAHAELRMAHTRRSTWAQHAARSRLLDAQTSSHGSRSPGLIIKLVNDIDTVLFGGTLRNRVLVHWIDHSVYTRKLQAAFGEKGGKAGKQEKAYLDAVTRNLATTVLPPARFRDSVRPAIYISAEAICFASQSRVNLIALLIHEMLHAYLAILTSAGDDDEEPGHEQYSNNDDGGEWGRAASTHGPLFDSSCGVLAARLGFRGLGGNDIARYYLQPKSIVQLRDPEKRVRVRLQDGLVHYVLPPVG